MCLEQTQSGAGLRPASYNVNSLNQITSRDVPGYIEDQGSASSNATVTVNEVTAYQKGNYYRGELAVDNSTAPVYQAITNQGALDTNSVFINGHALVTKTPEMLGCDADGNLTNDGKWNYTWDGENRLSTIQSLNTIPDAAKRRMEYCYDEQGRRIYAKLMEWNTNTASYQLITEDRYWYDGWNIIGRADLATALVQNFVWGLDLSRTMQGAGGVGGLLMLDDSQGASYFYGYDGNGNVLVLFNANDGTVVAQYDYDPFLGAIRANGPMAKANPFLGSTKFYDWETGLHYYGYRLYESSAGRWLSRDPVEENGGLHVYGFVANDSVNSIDLFGLVIKCHCPDVYFDRPEIGLKGKFQQDDKDPDLYSAKTGEAFNETGAGEILWTMLQDARTFTAKDLKSKNLELQVSARLKVIAEIANVRWHIDPDTPQGFNPTYWSGPMLVKGGVNPSTAINDAFSANANKYTTGCHYTAMLILLKGVLDTIGNTSFDSALAANGAFIDSRAYGAQLLKEMDVPPGGPQPTLKNWVPGDKGYIVGGAARGADGMNVGENVIYMGGGKFWGAPGGPSPSLDDMMGRVRLFSNGAASETGERIYPFVGLQ